MSELDLNSNTIQGAIPRAALFPSRILRFLRFLLFKAGLRQQAFHALPETRPLERAR